MNSIKRVLPTNKNYYQGYYNPVYPEKYLGDVTSIIYRSSYEYKFMVYCDKNDKIIQWSSEPVGIKYVNPIDEKTHNYFIDFYIKIINSNGILESVLIEIKPESQISAPIYEAKRHTLNKVKNYNYAMKMYIQNIAKWKAAKEYAESRNMKFMVITEKFLK